MGCTTTAAPSEAAPDRLLLQETVNFGRLAGDGLWVPGRSWVGRDVQAGQTTLTPGLALQQIRQAGTKLELLSQMPLSVLSDHVKSSGRLFGPIDPAAFLPWLLLMSSRSKKQANAQFNHSSSLTSPLLTEAQQAGYTWH